MNKKGKSLREGNMGGPRLRVYGGFKYEFALFSSRADQPRTAASVPRNDRPRELFQLETAAISPPPSSETAPARNAFIFKHFEELFHRELVHKYLKQP